MAIGVAKEAVIKAAIEAAIKAATDAVIELTKETENRKQTLDRRKIGVFLRAGMI